MPQKWMTALITTGVFFCGKAGALGLGQMMLYSSLSQPLNADIELLDTAGIKPEQITAVFGSEKDFRRGGIARSAILDSLRLETIAYDSGVKIRLSSKSPIDEPFIQFLLEVKWPEGRVLREYTILLDPPAFGTRTLERGNKTEPDSEASKINKLPEKFSNTYEVKPDDNLWEIASELSTRNNTNVERMMSTLIKENPHAFINGDPDKLIKNTVLVIPESQDIDSTEENENGAQQESNASLESARPGMEDISVAEHVNRLQRLSEENEVLTRQLEHFESQISSLKKVIDDQNKSNANTARTSKASKKTGTDSSSEIMKGFQPGQLAAPEKVNKEKKPVAHRSAHQLSDKVTHEYKHTPEEKPTNNTIGEKTVTNLQDRAGSKKELPHKKTIAKIETGKKPVEKQDWYHMLFGNFYNFLLLIFGAMFVLLVGWHIEKRRRQRQEEKEMDAILEEEALEEENKAQETNAQSKEILSGKAAVFSELISETIEDENETLAGEKSFPENNKSTKSAVDEKGQESIDPARKASFIDDEVNGLILEDENPSQEIEVKKTDADQQEITNDQGSILKLLDDENEALESEAGQAFSIPVEPDQVEDDKLSEQNSTEPEVESLVEEADISAQLEQINEEINALSETVSPSETTQKTPAQKEDGQEVEAVKEETEDNGEDEENSSIPSLLDLARAYLEMGDTHEAKGILQKVIKQGDELQQGEAKTLLGRCDEL